MKQQGGQKVMVWVGFTADQVIGPYFFPNEGTKVSVTSTDYFYMLNHFFLQNFQGRPSDFWFMHDGAPIHHAGQIREWLN